MMRKWKNEKNKILYYTENHRHQLSVEKNEINLCVSIKFVNVIYSF